MQYHQAIGMLPHVAPALSQFPVPTPAPGVGQLLVKVELFAMVPMAAHMLDFGYMVDKAETTLLPGTVAGTVAVRGESVRDELQVGTKVVVSNMALDVPHGASQEMVLAEENFVMVVPEGLTLEQAVTVGSSAVTAFHVLRIELGLAIPLDLPNVVEGGGKDQPAIAGASAEELGKPVLVWGGSTSTGYYAIQILKATGYREIITTSSPGAHARLAALGATHTLSSSDPLSTADRVLSLLASSSVASNSDDDADGAGPFVPYVLDCVADVSRTLAPIARVTGPGSQVVVLGPVRAGGEYGRTERLVGEAEVGRAVRFGEGVEVRYAQTFAYAEKDPLLGALLQPSLLPLCLKRRLLAPQPYARVDGASPLERVGEALGALRAGRARGDKLVVSWR